ncbi:MAG: acetyltransferase [Synergistaceae bacterium]|jgi:sugar O-acyltransferase (sialic acid O-acetyltransferase NeuD family)|nr:acetyltransferase [Synergistaceae bacterium]
MILGIYGAGGLGREILELARQTREGCGRWKDIVFIDDSHSEGADEILKGVRVMGFDAAAGSDSDIEVVIAVGEPSVRARLAERVAAAGVGLATLVHPGVNITDCTSVGEGTIIGCGAIVSPDVTIGRNVLLQPLSVVAHDCRIGDNSVVSTFVIMAGACAVGERVYIGMSATIKERVTIGDDVIIGMCSAVYRDVPSGMIALGNPARVARENSDKSVFK